MKVIYLKDLPGQARKNEIKEVNDGFATNFLLPKKIAAIATDTVIKRLENETRQRQVKQQKIIEKSNRIKSDLDKRTFNFEARVNDQKHVYGSVSQAEIAAAISKKLNIPIDKNQIDLPKHIKELGEYTVSVKLAGNIIANPKVNLINNQQK